MNNNTLHAAARCVGQLRMPLVCVLLALQAAGCAPLVVGGAVLGSTVMLADRRTAGAQVEDQAIELKAGNRLKEVLNDRSHVNITSYNRTVLLTGEAATDADKANIEQTVQKVENVRSTVNELAVMLPSALTTRSNDALITGKVKATFIDAKDLQANAFKVVTERGVHGAAVVTEQRGHRHVFGMCGLHRGQRRLVFAVDVQQQQHVARRAERGHLAREHPCPRIGELAPHHGVGPQREHREAGSLTLEAIDQVAGAQRGQRGRCAGAAHEQLAAGGEHAHDRLAGIGDRLGQRVGQSVGQVCGLEELLLDALLEHGRR
jgi:osmotically-inducible protein OsmY